MIEIRHAEITFENVPLDEQQAGAVTGRALELLEQYCAKDENWRGSAERLSLPPVRLEATGSESLAERLAGALHEQLADRFARK